MDRIVFFAMCGLYSGVALITAIKHRFIQDRVFWFYLSVLWLPLAVSSLIMNMREQRKFTIHW